MKRRDLIDVIYCARGAMQNVIDHWSTGELAEAVNAMQDVLDNELEPAIAWWEEDQDD